MARITGFREIREEGFEVNGFTVKRIPHIIPVFVVSGRKGFAVLGFMVRALDTGEASAEALVYENTLPRETLKEIAEKIAERL